MSQNFVYKNSDGFTEESSTYETSDFVAASAGVGDAAKPIITDAAGKIDPTFIDFSSIDHGGLSGLTDDDHTIYTKADGTRAFTGDQSMGSNKLTSLATPTAGTDGANKAYVDDLLNGLSWKQPVSLATTADISLTGEQTIDGTMTSTTDILVHEQNAPAENGIYTSAAGAWSRRADMDDAVEFSSSAVMVENGSTQADQGYTCTSTVATVDTDPVVFIQFTKLGQVTAGAGLTKTNGTIDVGAGTGMTINADDIAIDFGLAGSKAISATALASTTNAEGASLIGIEDSASNFTATDVEGALSELFEQTGGPEYTAGAGGVTKGDLLYISATDTVLPTTTSTNAWSMGLAMNTAAAASSVNSAANDQILAGVLTAATPGATIYWNGTAHVETQPAGSGAYVWKTGQAKNATDLHVEVEFVKKNKT